MDRAELINEVQHDYRRTSQVMADAHRLFHGSDGWNKCEMDPCHTVCVFMGGVAVALMELGMEAPERA